MTDILFVHWHVDPVLFHIGSLGIRWYSLLFVSGFIIGWYIFKKFFAREGVPEKLLDPLLYTLLICTIVGARLGHCLFYQPDYYFSSWQHFVEMLLPIDFTPTGIRLVGYRGLASHGGTIGIMLGIYLYCRKYGIKYLECLDMICVATPMTAAAIRMGNLMNSEIVGKATGSDWGFVFVQLGEDFPRHPAQLYEAIAYLVILVIGLLIYRKNKQLVSTGFYFGYCIFTIFLFRFFVEFCKEVQVDFEQGMAFDMGQLLSVPFIVIGLYFMLRGLKEYKKTKA